MRRLAAEVRLFWTALTLLTRLPAPTLAGFQPDWLPRSTSFFPVVGLLVGLLAAAVHVLASELWPGLVPPLLALAAAAWVTGGLHEDGWADVCDALAAGGDRERALAVMKDSRIGSGGALALAFLLLGKLAALGLLPAAEVPAALVAAHVLSRWSSVPLLQALPYARPEGGMAQPLASRVSAGRLAAATALALLFAVAALRREALFPLAAAAVATLAAGLFFRRRLGGITGDCLGATNQLVELTVFLALAARSPLAP